VKTLDKCSDLFLQKHKKDVFFSFGDLKSVGCKAFFDVLYYLCMKLQKTWSK